MMFHNLPDRDTFIDAFEGYFYGCLLCMHMDREIERDGALDMILQFLGLPVSKVEICEAVMPDDIRLLLFDK